MGRIELLLATEAIPPVLPAPVSRSTVIDWCARGLVKAVRYGQRWYVTAEEVERLRCEGTRPPARPRSEKTLLKMRNYNKTHAAGKGTAAAQGL